MKYFLILLLIAGLLGAGCRKSTPNQQHGNPGGGNHPNDSFAKGADVSWLTQMEAAGYFFYDSNGVKKDCFQILAEKGINAIRLRAWVNPSDGWCDTHDLVVKALRAKQYGFRILVDLHYSDVWADPGHQLKPALWDSLSFAALSDSLSSYTYHVMDTLRQNGIIPSWVQVGNETDDGLLWEDGRASTNMAHYAALVTSGYKAVKSVSDSTLVVVHVSNGFDSTHFQWLFDGLRTNGANWDVIGMSLYPNASNWADLNTACLANMQDMLARYGKPVMICEIGMPAGAASACQSFIADLVEKTRSLSRNQGLGVFYWEPEAYNWESYGYGAFNANGQPTVALDGFIE